MASHPRSHRVQPPNVAAAAHLDSYLIATRRRATIRLGDAGARRRRAPATLTIQMGCRSNDNDELARAIALTEPRFGVRPAARGRTNQGTNQVSRRLWCAWPSARSVSALMS